MKTKTMINYIFLLAFILMLTVSAYNFGMFNDNFISSQDTNFTKLIESYHKQKKPIVFFAYSENVRYCVTNLPKIKDLSKKYEDSVGFIIINTENSSGMDFANLNNIKVVPSFLFFNNKGGRQKLLQGYVELGELESEINLLLTLGGKE